MFAIYKKELRSYFINAIGYVYVGVFLAVAAFLCMYTTLGSQTYETSGYFTFLIMSFIIMIPLLTMKLFAEEKKLRTEQLLLTAPVTIWGVVMGKFLAAATLFVGTIIASCVNFIPLYLIANEERLADEYGSDIHVGPATGEIIACILGVIFIGLAFIAIGMFISSLTENQLAAAVITVTIILVWLMFDVFKQYIPTTGLPNIVGDAVNYIINGTGILSRFTNFTQGLLDFSAFLYYGSIAGVFLLLTVRVYDKRRWG